MGYQSRQFNASLLKYFDSVLYNLSRWQSVIERVLWNGRPMTDDAAVLQYYAQQ